MLAQQLLNGLLLRRRLRAVCARLHADVRRARRHQPYLWLLLLDRRIRRALRDAIPAHAYLGGAAVCGSRHRPDRHRHRRSAARASASRQGAGTLLADGDARRHAAALFADDGLVHDGHPALSARGVQRRRVRDRGPAHHAVADPDCRHGRAHRRRPRLSASADEARPRHSRTRRKRRRRATHGR